MCVQLAMANVKRVSVVSIYFLIHSVLMFKQNAYQLIHERAEVSWYNKSCAQQIKFYNFKYNRTTAVTNVDIDFKLALGFNLVAKIEAYKFLSNEYRPFAINFQFNLCQYVEKDEFGLHMLQACGNFSCPLKTGRYHVCQFAFDGSRFPPHLPAGKWKLNVLLLDESRGLAKCADTDFYVTVQYPIV